MDLIFGGAYQGKREFVCQHFDIKDSEIFTCKTVDDCETPQDCIDTLALARTLNALENKGHCIKAIDDIDKFVFTCVQNGIEAREYFEANKDFWQDKILIMTDISQGVVPIKAEERAWREMNGRLMAYLAGEARSVTRIFCGLPHVLK